MNIHKNSRFKKRYVLPIICSLVLLIGIITVVVIKVPFLPKDTPDTLDLLYLDLSQEPSPLFKVESQITYPVQEPSLDFQSSEFQEPSLNNPVNLVLNIDTVELDTTSLMTYLETVSAYAPSVTVSLISNDLNDEAYIELGNQLQAEFLKHELGKVTMIWYPQANSNLDLYQTDSIKHIGTVLDSSTDLEQLALLYDKFSDSATLYVRENIVHQYGNNVSLAIEEINNIYYRLAIQYPKVNTIFSPYRVSPLVDRDDYYLDKASADYITLSTIYYQLCNKPWITFSNQEVSNISPYKPVNTYTTLSGQVELILSPYSSVLSTIASSSLSSETAHLTYKLDELMLPTKAYYPYSLNLDTSQYANGISRVKACLYGKDDHLIEIQNRDITIDNPIIINRADRSNMPYPISAKSIYKNQYIPILMYHSIFDKVPEEDRNSCVETANFEAQMKKLIEEGYTPINFKTLKDYMNQTGGLPEKPILITMDDGYINNYTNAYPIYEKYQIQATLFVSPYYMQNENTERHFGWNAAREMEESGLIDIQCHGYDHTPLTYLSLKGSLYHVSHSFGLIEEHLGKRDVQIVAFPQFRNTKAIRKQLSSLGIDFQITKLAKSGTVLDASNLKRINVPDTMSPEELIEKIESLTN